ncbi:hypothetical protein Tco_0493440 [Tanacetum coccineum]
MDLDFAANENLRKLSGKEAWEAIENFAQGQKEWDNPPNIISEQEIANLKAQAKRLFGNEDVWVEIYRGIAWDKVENPDPQVFPSFEEYAPPVTYPKEVEETIRTPIEVEPLEETQLEDFGLNTYDHDIPLSNREVPSFDEPEPQPNCPSLDVSLGEERGPGPPIKPHIPDSFKMKEVDHLTNYTPPLPHVASFHPKDTSCYYHPCIGDPKKPYGIKSGLLGQSGSLGVDFLNMEMIENDWELESKYFSFGRHLDELHVTLAHLEKKRTRLRTYTNITQDNVISSWRRRHQYNVTPSQRRPRRRHGISRRRQSTRPRPLSRIFSTMTVSRLKRDAVTAIFLYAQAKILFGNENVWVEMHRGIAWDKVENSDPQSTPQFLPSFEEYTLPVTYPEEVEETLGTPIKVEPLDETQLEDLGLNICNHEIPLSSREVPSFDKMKPQP